MTCRASEGWGARSPTRRAEEGSRRNARAKPKTRRAPERRAQAADFQRPWKSRATSKPALAQPGHDGPGLAQGEPAGRGGSEGSGPKERMPFEERPRGRLHDPARFVPGPGQGEERGKGVDDVADRRQPDQERLQPRIRARRARVSWSLASPTMATRPPYARTESRSGTVSGV